MESHTTITPVDQSGITVTDLFCGAGGSSLGMHRAGLTVEMAANHWAKAVEVHQSHFPDTRHDLADISQADPRRYPVTDLLWASPECTRHSQARGTSRRQQDPRLWDAPDPAAERSRATMWDPLRFAEQNRYAAIVVENVVECTKWIGWRSWCILAEDLEYDMTILRWRSMRKPPTGKRNTQPEPEAAATSPANGSEPPNHRHSNAEPATGHATRPHAAHGRRTDDEHRPSPRTHHDRRRRMATDLPVLRRLRRCP